MNWKQDIANLITEWLSKVKMVDGKYLIDPSLKCVELINSCRLCNENSHQTPLINSLQFMYFSWGLPRRAGKSQAIKQIEDGFGDVALRLKCINKHVTILELIVFRKVLVLIDEYPTTWEVLQDSLRGIRSKDILIVKLETPKLA